MCVLIFTCLFSGVRTFCPDHKHVFWNHQTDSSCKTDNIFFELALIIFWVIMPSIWYIYFFYVCVKEGWNSYQSLIIRRDCQEFLLLYEFLPTIFQGRQSNINWTGACSREITHQNPFHESLMNSINHVYFIAVTKVAKILVIPGIHLQRVRPLHPKRLSCIK